MEEQRRSVILDYEWHIVIYKNSLL